ncbi:CDK5 and ABL1 enzyme substrate 2-like isoform X5 [Thunnus albacares]|uniref:CDK5 and ABL1 enzyme substrate 2-like isoform X5 n=1 Tax=Thunnus albacares TaxID=8236 RepID=UPI001CF60E84|nr:CDK5 and ABL1 enzyme substrate 2-like isoform X5 [Thunnus albacares]
MLPGLEGFQLDTNGRSVSYAQFLYPTNALVRQKPSSTSDLTLQIPVSRSTHSMPGRSFPPSRLNSTVGLDLGVWRSDQSAETDRRLNQSEEGDSSV